MKANATEYRLIATRWNLEQPLLLMVTWDKEYAEETRKELNKKLLVTVEIEEVEL